MLLELTLPNGESATTGKQITFKAPCPSDGTLTQIVVQGKVYNLVDSIGKALVPKSFAQGAMVSIILNNETSQAFIQNPSSTRYIEEQLARALNPAFTEAKTLEKLNSGESLTTLFSKVAKLISDYLDNGNSGGTSGNTDVNITASAVTLSSGSEAVVTKKVNEDGSIHFTFGIPKGEDGDAGVSPTITVSKSDGVTTLTITNADGSQTTSTINDGYVPAKGVDYYTPEDKEEIVAEVREAIMSNPVDTIDFSNFENGSFIEIVDGESIEHKVTFDAEGRPATIDGTIIVWGSA